MKEINTKSCNGERDIAGTYIKADKKVGDINGILWNLIFLVRL